MLFVSGGLTQKAIAERFGKSTSLISKWAVDGKWVEVRMAQTVTPEEIIARTYAHIQTLYQKIEKEERPITASETDQISKLMAGVRDLKKNADLSLYAEVFEEFIKYLRREDPTLVDSIGMYQLDFLTKKAQELTK